MPRTDEAEHWFAAVYSAVQEIPRGKVTSYGHIACLLGYPQRPRQVGICLKHLPSNPEEEPGSAERQAEVLRAEGVEVRTDAMGESSVDFAQFGWFPEILPSELEEDLEESHNPLLRLSQEWAGSISENGLYV
ncbi:hypothetical protein BDV25DRAFT_138692 [Aspergillus avenaceus]|uniref:Methylated-DNA-[protein]-cysteine S-methyltransferase DNA binding domain-containing protein n=1 Tax=Aspergillus avenaceus TaxID=36643 RepID=A0A5N6TYY5_ASPAV|nr:hypothetical protein BDV25DRAFT_138692 [Aspergillus avenaceus]